MTVTSETWIIRGRVQGVGYRDWMVRAARTRGVAGWVRNRAGGEVEALVSGAAESVASLHAACLQGPPLADVTTIERGPADPPAEASFGRLSTK